MGFLLLGHTVSVVWFIHPLALDCSQDEEQPPTEKEQRDRTEEADEQPTDDLANENLPQTRGQEQAESGQDRDWQAAGKQAGKQSAQPPQNNPSSRPSRPEPPNPYKSLGDALKK